MEFLLVNNYNNMSYKVNQIVKNKRSGLVRRITKVAKGNVSWISKDGEKKGTCLEETMNSWSAGKDNR